MRRAYLPTVTQPGICRSIHDDVRSAMPTVPLPDSKQLGRRPLVIVPSTLRYACEA